MGVDGKGVPCAPGGKWLQGAPYSSTEMGSSLASRLYRVSRTRVCQAQHGFRKGRIKLLATLHSLN